MAVGAGGGSDDPRDPERDPLRGAGTQSRLDPTAGETADARRAEAPTTADPGPLGLAAFAMTTFVLSMFNANLVNQKGVGVVLGLALFYGGAAQLLAGMWEFRTGNTFGALAFTSYGAFWLSFWAYEQFYAKGVAAGGATTSAFGLYLAAWALFTFYMFIASLRTTGAIALVLILLTATFALLAAGIAGSNTNIVKVGGYVGIATAAAAWYASFAGVTNATFRRTVLPVFPAR